MFGDYHVLAAVGVDADGRKHVLGLCGGASENTEVTAGLLEDLVARGLRADRRRLFVIDGAKALRRAIGRVFGSSNLVQRCRNHKVRNVLGHLPKEQHEQARSTLRAAWKLDADEGIRKLGQYASWLEREWPSAAASLREGLSELFTVNRLGLPKALRRCLTTTNIIDSSHAGVRQHTNRVSRWQSEEMAVRWAAVTFRETEKHYRRITGYEHLWMLKAHLNDEDGALAELQKAGKCVAVAADFQLPAGHPPRRVRPWCRRPPARRRASWPASKNKPANCGRPVRDYRKREPPRSSASRKEPAPATRR